MKVTRCYLFELADGKIEQTLNRDKARKAFEDGLEVVETETIAVSNNDDESVTIVVTRRWKPEK